MTLRPLLAAIALSTTTVAAGVATAQPSSETTAANTATATRTTQLQRKADRTRPGVALKPRMIEAPGAAVMIIPASYDAARNGPFKLF